MRKLRLKVGQRWVTTTGVVATVAKVMSAAPMKDCVWVVAWHDGWMLDWWVDKWGCAVNGWNLVRPDDTLKNLVEG
jgi:hypothetical protein